MIADRAPSHQPRLPLLKRIWEQHARSFDPRTVVNETHPVKAVLPVVLGPSLLLLAMYYIPAARDFSGLDRPWIPIAILLLAGAISIAQWANWERQDLVRVLALFDNCLYLLAIVAVMIDSTSPTRYVWGLLYAQAAAHYADRYSFSWPMLVSVMFVPFGVTLAFAGKDYGLIALALFGGVMYVVKSTTTEHVRKLEIEKERYRAAYEISDKVAGESLDIAIAASVAEFGNLAHELRNSSTPILGNLMILKEHEEHHPEIKESVESLERSFVRSAEILEKMLSSIKRRARVSDDSFRLDEVMDGGVITKGLIPGDRGKVQVDGLSVPFEVKGNSEYLIGAIGNLIQNALNAEVGEVAISGSIDGGFKRAVIQVSDDGPGLPDTVMENLFQPGVAGENGSSHGLGLPLSRRLVEVLGGSLRLAKTGPEGTTFEIVLPGRYLLESSDTAATDS